MDAEEEAKQAVAAHISNGLRERGWTVEIVREPPLSVAFCVFNGNLFRRKVVMPEAAFEDAAGHGGPSWPVNFVEQAVVVEQLQAQDDVRVDDPIDVPYP